MAHKKIFILAGLIFLSGCSEQEERVNFESNEKIVKQPSLINETKETVAGQQMDTTDYSQKNFFDDCPGLEAYKEKNFYKNLITDLKIEDKYAPSYSIPSPGRNDYMNPYVMTNACYSEKMGRILMVFITADMWEVPVFVIDYDINKREPAQSNTIIAMVSNYYFTKHLDETFELRGDCSACARIKETILSYNLKTRILTKVEEVKNDPIQPGINMPAID